MAIQVQERDSSAPSCVYCRDALGADAVACRGCGVELHPDCAAEVRACPILGCGGGFSVSTDASRPPPEPATQPGTHGEGIRAAVGAGLVTGLAASSLSGLIAGVLNTCRDHPSFHWPLALEWGLYGVGFGVLIAGYAYMVVTRLGIRHPPTAGAKWVNLALIVGAWSLLGVLSDGMQLGPALALTVGGYLTLLAPVLHEVGFELPDLGR